MSGISSIVVVLLMLTVLCVPPLLFVLAARKRLSWANPASVHFARIKVAMYVAAVALLINLAITVTQGSAIAADTQALGWVHAIALGLAWVCLWGRFLLGTLFRRRDLSAQ